jgi:DNA adenine methylase
MKLKPIVKVSETKNYLASWIIEKFPPDYKELSYVEPFLGGSSVLLNKEPSIEEIANECDASILRVWQSFRDEPKLFVSKLKRINCEESTFIKYQNKKETDYLNEAVVEFVLRNMSKGGMKKSYMPKKIKRKEHCWHELFGTYLQIHERLKNVFLLNRDPVEVVRAFGSAKSLIYCDIPSENEKMDENKHIELGGALCGSKGKVIITAKNSAMYKRIYADWNRKGVPGKPKESAWFNF